MTRRISPLAATLIALLASGDVFPNDIGGLAPEPVDIVIPRTVPAPLKITKSNTTSVTSDISTEGKIEVITREYITGPAKVRREVKRDLTGNYVNHGEWRAFGEDGDPIAVGRYHNGLPDGRWTYVHSATTSQLYSKVPYNKFTEPFTSTATLQNGKLHGTWTIVDKEERTVSVFEFINGQRNGLCKWYFPSGQLMQEITYTQGLIDGQLRKWDADGNLILDDNYQKGRRHSLQVRYDAVGNKKSEGMYLRPQLVIDSSDDWWNAKLATYKVIGTNDRHGNWTEWHPNGQSKVTGRYVKNIRDGEFTWWYADGKRQIYGNYRNGKKYGVWVWWHSNGQKAAQGFYVNDKSTNNWAFWNPNGQLIQIEDVPQIRQLILDSESRPETGRNTSITSDGQSRRDSTATRQR